MLKSLTSNLEKLKLKCWSCFSVKIRSSMASARQDGSSLGVQMAKALAAAQQWHQRASNQSVCKSGLISHSRPSNRVCGVFNSACQNKERPLASWSKFYHNKDNSEHPRGASGDSLVCGEHPWSYTNLLDLRAWPSRRLSLKRGSNNDD